MSIILASQSPRRKQLLEWAEIDFEVIVAPTEETYPDNLSLEEIPIYIAKQKALAVEQKTGKEKIIVAADTVVVLNNKIIGKPKNREDAIKILSDLSGNEHCVITGVVILSANKQIAFADTTYVQFHALTQEQIIFYVDKYKPYDKAGAYAIQEWIGVIGIQSIQGDFYNVMGLPVSKVVQALNSLK
ncbi:MAG: septum formation protein Maf [Chitinophagaceae bacterium]|nr:septum formation protein Maf [Chitinophagaceae bacterium]MCW5904649.1 septum formation protein Maf [Chitinophagaceae bacterium]